jgi:hypothetical protein
MGHIRNQTSRLVWTAFYLCCASHVAADGAMDNANVLERLGAPSENRLIIEQSDSGGHSARVILEQEKSLLLRGTWAGGFTSTLRPGRITQIGSAHILTARFDGAGHQIAVRQSGSAHRATLSSQGQGNSASISQSGHGNNAGITQAGLRNSVAIVQN